MLAFLMLLLCIMVASSVLAAAGSNAGRIKSNRIEQQKYMTLTSAVRLICDDLETAGYTAEYGKYEWEAAGVSSTEKCFYIRQISGECSGNKLKDQIPLEKWLNYIFFSKGGEGYEALSGTTDNTLTCALTVTLPDGLKGYPYYQVDQTVTVQVKIDPATYNIMLTAWLGDVVYDPTDGVKVTAELAAGMDDPSPLINHHGNGSALPVLPDGAPALPVPNDTNQTAGPFIKDGNTVTFTTIKKETLTSMTWKLNWIKKGE